MSDHRRVEVLMWTHEKFRRMSSPQPCGQSLWIYLLTNSHTGAVPGLFRAGRAAMAEELGWSLEGFDKSFQEVFDQGMVDADFDVRLVWLPNAIKYNQPQRPHTVRMWRRHFKTLPDCDLKSRATHTLWETLGRMGPGYLTAFAEMVGEDPRGMKGGQP